MTNEKLQIKTFESENDPIGLEVKVNEFLHTRRVISVKDIKYPRPGVVVVEYYTKVKN
jgi:hypothetical protein